jgi:hypothetical protein
MMQITRAALQDQVNPFTQATTLMSHTPVNCYTILGEDSSSPTNPMIDPYLLLSSHICKQSQVSAPIDVVV